MQKRVKISGIPCWIGIYDEGRGECHAVGEVRGRMISVKAATENIAINHWVAEAESLLCSSQSTLDDLNSFPGSG